MSNTDLILEEKSAKIGNFRLGRYLPMKEKRQIGPFTFIDHIAPAKMGPDQHVEVDQHPHIGLCTLTYLIKGAMQHADSMGNNLTVNSDSVGLMTAGKGCTHTERTPEHLKNETIEFHGYQIWIALPKNKENMEPEFDIVNHDQLPVWEQNGLQMKLIAGSGYGKSSPLKVHSELFMLDARSTEATELIIEGELQGEIGIIIEEGSIATDGQTLEKGHILISDSENKCSVEVGANSHLIILGGKPFPEPRFIDWNFVSSSKETIREARQKWKNKEFPKVPGDDTYIPLPVLKA